MEPFAKRLFKRREIPDAKKSVVTLSLLTIGTQSVQRPTYRLQSPRHPTVQIPEVHNFPRHPITVQVEAPRSNTSQASPDNTRGISRRCHRTPEQGARQIRVILHAKELSTAVRYRSGQKAAHGGPAEVEAARNRSVHRVHRAAWARSGLERRYCIGSWWRWDSAAVISRCSAC
jgi:hypothetical protein